MTHAAYDVRQQAFRFYDDGTESGSTAKAAQGTNITVTMGSGNVLLQLRVAMEEFGGAAGSGSTFQLQYNKNSTSYTNVTGATSNIRASAGSVTDDEVTTNRLTGFSGTFTAGRVDEADGNTTTGVSIVANGFTEILYSLLLIDGDLANGDTLDFQLLDTGDSTVTYNAVPRITISKPVTGSGTPTAATATASGSGTIIKTGSGSPQAATATASGSGTVGTVVTGSGSPTAATATASGTGEITKTGSGTPQAQTATASGAGVIIKVGTGTPQAVTATASGSGTITKTGSGTPQAVTATASGSGTITRIGSGSPQAQTATASGTGTVGNVVTGSGAPQAATATASGSGEIIKTGSGSPQAATATVTASGTIIKTGSGSPQAATATVSGTGTVSGSVIGSGAPQAVTATVSATGIIIKTGSGAVQAVTATASGSGSVTSSNVTGSGAPQAATATTTGAGLLGRSGSGTPQATTATCSGSGTVTAVASSSTPAAAATETVAAFVEDFDAYFDLDVFGEEFIYTPPGAYPFRSDKSVTVVGIFSEYRFKLGKINQDVPSVIFKSTDLTSIARGAMVERVSSDHQYMVHGWEMEGEDITRLLLTVTAAPADASISYPRFPEDMTVFYDLDVFGEQFTYTPPGTFPHRSDKSKTITGIFSEYRIRADRVDQDVPSVSFPAGELTDLARGAMVERGTKRYKVQGWEMEGEAVTRLILELHE